MADVSLLALVRLALVASAYSTWKATHNTQEQRCCATTRRLFDVLDELEAFFQKHAGEAISQEDFGEVIRELQDTLLRTTPPDSGLRSSPPTGPEAPDG